MGKAITRISVTALLVAAIALSCCPVARAFEVGDALAVKAAKRSLSKGKVNVILVWVSQKDEKEVTEAFNKTLAARKAGGEAREVADRFFVETVVRLRRAERWQSYTGLDPALSEQDQFAMAADKAIEAGSLLPIWKTMVMIVREGIKERFIRVMDARGYHENDIAAGRRYVKAYSDFVQCLHDIYDAARKHAEPAPEKTGRR